MATDIELNTKIDTGSSSQSISELKKTLKDLIDSAEKVNTSGKVFKGLSEEIQKTKEQIKDATSAFNSQKDSIEKTINPVTALKQQLKELISQQLQVAPGTQAFRDLAQAINDTEGQLGDLNDSFNNIRGSGVERLNASTGLLREGFENFDVGKIKLAFQGLGQAMSAIPLLLLVEGFKYLVDNFEKVISVAKDLFNIFSKEETAVKNLTKEYEAQKKSTSDLSKEKQKEIDLLGISGTATGLILEKKKELIALQVKELEASIKLNKAKMEEAVANDTVYESLFKIAGKLNESIGLTKSSEALNNVAQINKKERSKEFQKLIDEDAEKIKDANNSLIIETAKFNKEQADKARALNDELKKLRVENIIDAQKQEEEKLKLSYDTDVRELKQKGASKELLKELELKFANDKADIENKYIDIREKDEADKKKKIKDINDKEAADRERVRVEMQALQLKSDQEEIAAFIEKENKKKEIKKATEDAEFQIAKSGVSSLQGLSDLAFSIKLANTQKGITAEENAARAQFKINKGLQIASAGITGLQGGLAAATAKSVIPEPFAMALRIANVAAIAATTTATIAKIAGTQFNSGGGGGGSTSVSLAGGSSGSPTNLGGGASIPSQNLTPFAFDRGTVGKIGQPGGSSNPSNQSGSQQNVVSVVEIANVMSKVKATEGQAKFG